MQPKNLVKNMGRSIIGNDVWLGRNVVITNGTNVGNDVIARLIIVNRFYILFCGFPAPINMVYNKE